MKTIFVLALVALSLSLHASMGSSVTVPTAEHLKYTFGNHKNHPVQKLEEKRYFRSLAPLNEGEIKNRLQKSGYKVNRIGLRDIASELVYEAHVSTQGKEDYRLFVDPANAKVLKREVLR